MFPHVFPEEINGNPSLNIQIIGEGIDGIKKERQAVRSKIKVLEDELKVVDAEIASLQEDLDAATARKDKAYESLQELRAVRDAKVSSSYVQTTCRSYVCPFSIIIMCYNWIKKRETLFLISSSAFCLDILVCSFGCFCVLFTVYHLEMAALD